MVLLGAVPGSERALLRSKAELEALGVTVESLSGGGARDELLREARARGAIAAVLLSGNAAGAEVILVDRVTSKTSIRTLDVSAEPAARREDAIAIGFVELLRASLLEIEIAERPRGEVDPPQAARALVRRPLAGSSAPPVQTVQRERGRLSVGPALLFAPGGLDASGHVAARGAGVPHEVVGVGATVLVPTLPSAACAPEGCARTSLFQASTSLEISYLGRRGPARPFLGAGAGVLWAHTTAEPTGNYIGTTIDVTTAWLELDAGIAITVVEPLSIRLDTSAALALPRPVISFAGTERATIGHPVLSAAVALEVSFYREERP
jgi:hypothetical protein